MTHGVSYETAVRQLTDMGVPRDKAEREARMQIAEGARLPDQRQTAQELPDMLWPVRLTIPWSALVSDNNKDKPVIRAGKPAKVLTPEYAAARQKIETIATRAVNGGAPAAFPLCFTGVLYCPTQRRVDATNFAKLVQDALSKIVYEDDHWLADVRWTKDVDIDAPRAEITIQPIAA